MGPRPFGLGNIGRKSHVILPLLASMGPRPFGLGNLENLKKWDFTIVLQWGQGHSALETDPQHAICKKQHRASMGPRPFGLGNVITVCKVFLVCVASMGPRPFGLGNQMIKGDLDTYILLQWGQGHSALETPSKKRELVIPFSCFNGAKAIRPWKRHHRETEW